MAVEEVEGREITLRFDGGKCIHARFCVLGAPAVFRANVEGPWIHPDADSAAHLAEVAHACPSGAITYTRHDGGPQEGPPPVNVAWVRENGPVAIKAQLFLDGQPIGTRAVLCRCGASKNKPFCDGSHNDAGFVATGEPESKATDMLAVRDGRIDITPLPNGPLKVAGHLELCSGTGRVVLRSDSAVFLCRCGASQKKPYCDGTHTKIGFVAPWG